MSESDMIGICDLPIIPLEGNSQIRAHVTLKETVNELEREWILNAYREHKSIRKAAKAIGIPATTLARKLKVYDPKVK